MEIVQVVGRDSQGLCQRVLIELVRRKITLETAVMGKKEGKMVMILGITNLPDKGKTLYALKASAEWLNDRVRCSWEGVPQNGHSFDIERSTREKGDMSF